jgi:hypothetical protein
MLSIAAEMQDDLMGSLDLDRQSLQISRELGDRINEAINLSNLGAWAGWTWDTWCARGSDMEAALQLVRANGDRVGESSALGNLSSLALWQGDETRALALARSALDIAVAAQAR